MRTQEQWSTEFFWHRTRNTDQLSTKERMELDFQEAANWRLMVIAMVTVMGEGQR